jgi:hypothetical protein
VEESQQVDQHHPLSCMKQHQDQKQSSSMFLHNLKMEMYLLLYIVFLPQMIKFTSCLPMVGDSLRVLRLLPQLKLVVMI